MKMSLLPTIELGYYRHSRTARPYRLHFIGRDAHSLDPVVIYEALYHNKVSQHWVRPAAQFAESITLGGRQVSRFTRITDEEGRAIELAWQKKSENPKHNAVVYVMSKQFTGYGIVNRKGAEADQCPKNQVPVLLGNGNTWWYYSDCVRVTPDKAVWPPWICRKRKAPKQS
jgi:hypothetical protein